MHLSPCPCIQAQHFTNEYCEIVVSSKELHRCHVDTITRKLCDTEEGLGNETTSNDFKEIMYVLKLREFGWVG